MTACTALFGPTESQAIRRSWCAATSLCVATMLRRPGHLKVCTTLSLPTDRPLPGTLKFLNPWFTMHTNRKGSAQLALAFAGPHTERCVV